MPQAVLYLCSAGAAIFILCLFPVTFNVLASVFMALATGLVAGVQWFVDKFERLRRS